jgi:hypothetical protein
VEVAIRMMRIGLIAAGARSLLQSRTRTVSLRDKATRADDKEDSLRFANIRGSVNECNTHVTDLHMALTKQGLESMAVIIPGMGHAFDTYAEEGGMVYRDIKVMRDAIADEKYKGRI